MGSLQSEYKFSNGTITSEITVSGRVRNGELLSDHLQSTIMTVLGSQYVQSGLIREMTARGQSTEVFEGSLKAGEITLNYKFNFTFKRDISRSTINRIVIGEIVPMLHRVASAHMADEATEQAVLAPQPTSLVRDTTSLLIGTAPRLPRSLADLAAMQADEPDLLTGRSGHRQPQHA
jgi:hypothetical protein